MTDAECTAINTQIVRETGRISPEIYGRIVQNTPWIALTPRDKWDDEMGIEQTNMLFARMLPAQDDEEWANVTPSDGSTNNCLPDVEIIKWGQNLRTWRLQKIAKETEEFCLEDIRSAFQLRNVLGKFTDGLAGITRWVWENRDRNEYIAMAKYKVTETGNTDFDVFATAFDPTNPPTSRLVWGTLERIYGILMRDGVMGIGFNGSNAPVLALLTDEVTQRDLFRQSPELRDDFRWAYAGKEENSPLLQAFFTGGHSYNGYKPMTDFYPARYEIVDGDYVRVKPFKDPTAASKGTDRELDPAYIYATYQDTPIHVPGVFTQRIPQPLSSPGGDFKFDPVDYMGNFRWVREFPGSKCNPDGTIGRFRAVFASASEPVHPEWGFVVRHLNCAPIRDLETSCYS